MMRKLTLLLGCGLLFAVAVAQVPAPGIYLHQELETPSLVLFNEDERPDIKSWQAVVRKLGAYGADAEWRIFSTIKDDLGMTHHRAMLYWQGKPVELSTIVLHEQHGLLNSLNGEMVPGSLIRRPSVVITRDEARKKALQYLPADKYYWEDSGQNAMLQHATGVADTGFFPSGTQVWCPGEFRIGQPHRMAWKFDVYALEPLGGKSIYVDAETGEILAAQDLILHAEVKGTAVTKYSGSRNIQTDSTAPGSYRLREAARGKGIETFNMKNGTSYGAAVDFTDADNYWNNVNVQKDEVATDAHWGAEMTYDYFKKEHNRNSFDNNGAKILSYVHYSSNYNNAFWNGVCMTYGDGNGTTFTPLTGLDVCGHEIAHAVTTNSANLVYSYESGALNESFSDIFGNTIEAWARPTQWNWRIGEDITPSKNGIRSMVNPNLFNHPKFYKGVSWYSGAGDNGGVHYNSGVQNYWYYLIANGAKGTNEKGWSFQIDSLGMTKAGKIAYRNLTVYLTRNSQYADARTYSIMAAADLYGQCSPEVINVTNAWWVCGVGAKYDSGYVKAGFRADTLACRTGQLLKFTNLSENYRSCRWYFGDGDTSTALNPQHGYNQYGIYSVKLVATSCFKTKNDSITRVAYVKVDSTRDICNAAVMPVFGTDSVIRCKGFVYDDGGEGNYGPLKQVNLKVKIPGADSIRFRFLVLDYENGYDSLVMFRNNLAWSNKIGRFTGSALPFAGAWRTVAGNALWFRQYSDPLVEGKGFKVEFEGIRPALTLNLGNDTTICYGDSLIITPAVGGGFAPNYLYRWAHGPNSAAVPVKPTFNSKYYLTVIDVCTGKSISDSIAVAVRAPLKVSLGRDTVICKGNTVRLRALPAGGLSSAYTYIWNQGLGSAASHLVTPTVTTSYSVILSDGCTDRPDTAYRTVYVRPDLKVNITAGSTPVCIGSRVSLIASGQGGDTAGYTYSWNNGLGSGAGKNVTLTDTGMYIVTLTDGCTVQPARDTVMLYTHPALKMALSNDTQICRGSSVLLSASLSGGKGSGYIYTWTGGKSGSSITESPAMPTRYKVTGTDGCSPAVSDSVFVDMLPALSLGRMADTVICDGQTLSVNLSVSGGKVSARQVTWTPSGVSGPTPVLNPPAGVTNYTAVLSDGCTVKNDTTRFKVTRLAPLSGNITVTPNSVCRGDSVTLQITASGGRSASRNWMVDGVPVAWVTRRLQPLSSTTYNLVISDGCSAPLNRSASVVVNVPPSASLTADRKLLCAGDEVRLTCTSPDAAAITWMFGGPDSAAGPALFTKKLISAGRYTVKARVKTTAGCSGLFSLTDTLTAVAYPAAGFTPVPAVTNIESPDINFTDNSVGAVQYLWLFGDGQSSAVAGSTSHTYADTGWYSVMQVVSVPPGCADTAFARVRVKDVYRLYLPTSFTPDQSGLNDRYTPSGRGIAVFKMNIYDRWGNKVFHTTDISKTWDGKDLQGRDLMSGTYVVLVDIIDTEGFRHEEKTILTILR